MPDPHHTGARTAAAALAAGVVAATMVLAGPGVVTVLVTVALVVGQALLLRGAGGARRTRLSLLAASAQAGLTYPVAGEDTVASALVYTGVGVVFGLVVVAGVGLLDRADRADPGPGLDEPDQPDQPDEPGEPRVDTRPLPVVEGD